MHTHEHGMRRTGVALALALTVAGGRVSPGDGSPSKMQSRVLFNGAPVSRSWMRVVREPKLRKPAPELRGCRW